LAKNPRLIDLSGQKFGKWLVIEQNGNTKGGAAIWKAQCSCGNIGYPIGSDLRCGKSISCGCTIKESARKRFTTHGQTKTRLYRIFKAMRTRCTNKKIPGAKNYSAKNITICDEWSDFEAFRKWAYENGYNDNLSIDRLDNSKGYSPDNCRWANALQQSVNRDFVLKSPSGEPWSQIAKQNGIPVTLFHSRKHEGWSCEHAATLPKGTRLKSHLARLALIDG
jgi:hypothetical protein